MKKIVFLSLFALCLPWMVSAQSIDDDLYYNFFSRSRACNFLLLLLFLLILRRNVVKVECTDYGLYVAG